MVILPLSSSLNQKSTRVSLCSIPSFMVILVTSVFRHSSGSLRSASHVVRNVATVINSMITLFIYEYITGEFPFVVCGDFANSPLLMVSIVVCNIVNQEKHLPVLFLK